MPIPTGRYKRIRTKITPRKKRTLLIGVLKKPRNAKTELIEIKER